MTAAPEFDLRVEVRPAWPFRLSCRGRLDGLLRVRDGVLHRLVHADDQPVLVRIAQPARGRVLFGARARTHEAAEYGIERMRFALGIDQNLGQFHERFRFDALIGRSVRANPGLRVTGRPDPFEALVWAICEQLIEYERAAAIQRRLVWRLGRAAYGFRDLPSPAKLAAQAPALLESLGLSPLRALALSRAAREVAAGRVDLLDAHHELGWRRLRAIRGIGSWSVQTMALTGQGRLDQMPAGDLAYLKLVGRLQSGGDPWARATEDEVAELFARYDPWAGLAGAHALRSCGSSGAMRLVG